MLERLKRFLIRAEEISALLQNLVSVKGRLFVDMFAVVMVVRLIAVLAGKPPLTAAEAGMWAATIATFGYSNSGPKNP